jgi:hypothetical protein
MTPADKARALAWYEARKTLDEGLDEDMKDIIADEMTNTN